MKKNKKYLSILLILILAISSIYCNENISYAAKKVSLSKKSVSMYIGTTYTLKLKNTNKGVKWTSNNKKVATVSQKGKITAIKAGNTTIVAKYKGKKYKAKIKVLNNKLNYSDMTVSTGSQWQFEVSTAKINPTWTSSDENVAHINKNGFLIATATGEAIVTAKIKQEELCCKITVVKAINKDDFYYPNSKYDDKNYAIEIEKGYHSITSYLTVPYGNAELNRGVEIGNCPEDVFAAFGVTDFYYITDFQKAHWGLLNKETDIVSVITYTLPTNSCFKEDANKSFCFDEKGSLIAIYWWIS